MLIPSARERMAYGQAVKPSGDKEPLLLRHIAHTILLVPSPSPDAHSRV